MSRNAPELSATPDAETGNSRSPRYVTGMGLKSRLAILISLGFILTTAVITSVNYVSSNNHFHHLATKTSEEITTLVAQRMSGAIKFNKVDRMQAIFDGVEIDPENRLTGIITLNAEGEMLAQLGQEPAAGASSIAAWSKSVLETNHRLEHIEEPYVQVAAPVLLPQTGEIVGVVTTLWNRSEMNAEITRSLLTSLMLAGLCSALVLIVTLSLIGRAVVKPLGQLTGAMAQIGNKEYQTTVPHSERSDEIGVVARNLEQFRDRLAAEEKTAARHVADEQRKTEVFALLSSSLSKVAGGDLSPRIQTDRFADMDQNSQQVCDDFNALMDGFGDMISTVVSSAESVRSSSAEISEVANAQSRRSESQASTLEESAAALDGLTKSVKSAAEHAAEADAAVSENRRQAESSGDVVRRAVSAMQQIEESSSQITQIISVIDDIAFQTNLLALNAGVEAARAGESGRGFAVVASEVRALAQRASESAREIKDLISKSGQQVSEGGALVSQTGDALAEIIGRFGKVSELVSSIAVSLREQSTGLEEINVGINELDKVTQQNATVIEETSASSQALSAEAERLSVALKKFSNEESEAKELYGKAVGSSFETGQTTTISTTAQTATPGELDTWEKALKEPGKPSEDWQDF